MRAQLEAEFIKIKRKKMVLAMFCENVKLFL